MSARAAVTDQIAVGSGKTTVCRHVTAGLHPSLRGDCHVSLTAGHVLYMYKSIACELGLPEERSRATAYCAIRNDVLEDLAREKL